MKKHRSDRYELIRRIQTSSSIQSYEASHPRHPGRFVVQVWSGGDSGNAAQMIGEGRLPLRMEAVAATRREVATISAIRHPFIAQVLEVTALPDGTPVVVSELPDGVTLQAWLDAGKPVQPRAIVRLIAELANALTAAHLRDISHGAVVAENIYLVGEQDGSLGLPKLQGFGLRRLRASCGERCPVDLPVATTTSAFATTTTATAILSVGNASDDLAQLARLAEQLLRAEQAVGHAARGQTTDRVQLPAKVLAVLRRASLPDAGNATYEPFDSALEFAVALELAVEAAVDPVSENRQRVGGARQHRRRGRPARVGAGMVGGALLAAALIVSGDRLGMTPAAVGRLAVRPSPSSVIATASAPAVATAEAAATAPEQRLVVLPISGEPLATALSTTATSDAPEVQAPVPARPVTIPAPAGATHSRALRGFVWSPSTQALVRAERAERWHPLPKRSPLSEPTAADLPPTTTGSTSARQDTAVLSRSQEEEETR